MPNEENDLIKREKEVRAEEEALHEQLRALRHERRSLAKQGDRNPSKRPEVRERIRQSLIKKSEEGLSKKQLEALRERRRLKHLRKHDREAYKKEMHERASARAKKAWNDPEIRARRLRGLKRAWGKQFYEARLEKVFTPETRAKISNAGKGRKYLNRKHTTHPVRWYSGKAGRIAMHGPLEVAYAKLLDTQGIEWLYEPIIFVIDDTRKSPHWNRWEPDFFLPAENKFVEIKGWYLPKVRRKIEHVIQHMASTKFEVLQCKIQRGVFSSKPA